MHYRQLTTGVVAGALAVGLAISPATATPAPATETMQPHFTSIQIAQLRQQIIDQVLVFDARENHHAAIHAKDLSAWMSPKGWETMDLITDSQDPKVTQLFQKKAKKDGITEAQARAHFKAMSTAGGIYSIRFAPTVFTEYGKTNNIMSRGDYKLAKRLGVGSYEIYFFEHVLKKKAGKKHWLILFPPGSDRSPSGEKIARHVHYVLGDTPFAILPPMMKMQMATMVEANASWDAKVGLLKLGLAY